jgi:hypothetical protein
MSDPQTRPGELSRAEAKKIAEEVAGVIGLAADERKYREHMLMSTARVEVKVDNLKELFAILKDLIDNHMKEDNDRFLSVTQSNNANSMSISKGVGMVAAIIAMLGLMMYIVDKVRS